LKAFTMASIIYMSDN